MTGGWTATAGWLKHQDNPVRPQVNMRGNYTSAYLERHRGASPAVDWSAGVVVPEESADSVDLTNWSPRANW